MRESKVLRRARARHDKTEKNVRATRCAVFMFENRVWSYLPPHLEVLPMLSNAKRVSGAVPGAIEKKSRAGKANDVRIDLSADVAQSVGSARARCIVGHNSRAHAVKKKKKLENVNKRVRGFPPGTTVRKQGDGTPLRRAYTHTREGVSPFGVPPRKLRLEP